MTIYHKHHIIPKHMGGTDDPDNLVEVTIEQHANLHKQLWEDLGDVRDYYAWKGLSGIEIDKIKLQSSLGGKIGGKKLKNRPKSNDHRKKLSEANIGKRHSQESIDRMKSALTGSNSKFAKMYRFVDPSGTEHKITGLNDFCRINNLSQSSMCMVARGRRKQHKGWKCMNVDLS